MTDKRKPGMGFEVNIDSSSAEENTTQLHVTQSARPEAKPDTPFCIAVLGDFSGSGGHGQTSGEIKPLSSRRFIEIDRDNFEEVMAEKKIVLNLQMDDERVQIDIKELDDFHPDELYDKVETFSKLRSLRRRLKNNKTFAEAAAEIQGWIPQAKPETETIEEITADSNKESEANVDIPGENLLDSILDTHHQQEPTSDAVEASHIDKLIRSIVAPYVEPAADPRQDEMIAMVDQATETHMRNILHHANFQAIESAWQSLYFLIKRLETGSKLKIKILDVTKQELQADLAVDDITTSAIYKKFCEVSEGDMPWSVLLGNFTFSDSIDDVLSLVNMGSVAQKSGAPFIAAANEKLAGCESFSAAPDYEDWNYEISKGVSDAWKMLRQSPVATYIGLALPKFLLRLPYGKKSKPVDSFVFEEMPEEHCHECYLWGNAAFIKVEMLARNFKDNGWQMKPQQVHQTDGLPMSYFNDDGEVANKPAAEIFLTERGGEIIRNKGLITLWSVRNSDSIRSADYCSVSEKTEEITGRWSQ